MNDNVKFALQCRQRAEELRSILPEMKDPQTRKIIENIIRDYDKSPASKRGSRRTN